MSQMTYKEHDEKEESQKLEDPIKLVKEELKTRPALAKILLTILLCLLLLLFFHPKLFNLRFGFGRHHEMVDLHYVSDFFLWTRQTAETPQRLVIGSNELVISSYFHPRKTYIIVHGFTGSGVDKWILRVKNALLWRENCNVISVSWQAGSITAGYYVIRDRVPYVAEDISKLIDFLHKDARLMFFDVHIIGHSLGAHIAGFTGKLFNGRLARITGLDPASLTFNGQPPYQRLDKSDAQFVDVIHTHGCFSFMQQWTDCYGTYDNIGHADFWPNGGEYQPACDGGDGDVLVREGSNCHHGLAYVFLTESIYTYSSSTRFAARPCLSWSDFNNNTCPCSSPTQYMGYNVNPKIEGVFYLNTSRTSPYGLLDPGCSSDHMSWLKLNGIMACILLIAYGCLQPFKELRSKAFNRMNKIFYPYPVEKIQ